MPEMVSTTADEFVPEEAGRLRAEASTDIAVSAEYPSLPARDPDPIGRAADLERTRGAWAWSDDHVAGMAVLKLSQAEALDPSQPLDHRKHLPVEAHLPASYLSDRAASLVPLAAAAIRLRSPSGSTPEGTAAPSIASYQALIRKPLVQPELCLRGLEDRMFAWQRVAGPNPMAIRGVESLPAQIHLDDALLEGVWREGLDLATELADGNIFIADYTQLDCIGTSQDDSGVRQVWPLVGVFHVDRKARPDAELMPLAIQLGTRAEPEQCYTPNDGVRWTIAKTAFQCADLTSQTLSAHLVRRLFALEGIVVACHRTLSARHPLMVLLRPHFKGVVFTNLEARAKLIGPGGKLDRLVAGGILNGLRLLRGQSGDPQAVASDDSAAPVGCRGASLEDFSLLVDLSTRKADRIPNYPYAEDAQNVWGVIHAFCREYVAVYYGHDDNVATDEELQDLIRELASQSGARMSGVRPVQTRAALADLLTHIIYTSGPQHAALNNSLYECAASAANMPFALYRSLPDDLKQRTDEQAQAFLLELLPPLDKAEAQLQLLVELTSFQPGRLGQYAPTDFTDPLIQAAVGRFQRRLSALEHLVDARNTARSVPYPYLKPTNIPCSASS